MTRHQKRLGEMAEAVESRTEVFNGREGARGWEQGTSAEADCEGLGWDLVVPLGRPVLSAQPAAALETDPTHGCKVWWEAEFGVH